MKQFYPLSAFLTEYSEKNDGNKYRPVAVGRYGIRPRESIYSKELAKDYSKNKLIHKNTLTVGMGSVQIDIGILTEDITYSVSPAYHTYRITGIDATYLRYCLECRNQDMFARFVKRGSRQGKTIDLKRWLTYEIPVYDMVRQAEIVDRLDRILGLIEKRKEQLLQLDQLVKSRFIELFGDPVGNPKGWAMVPLGTRCEIITGNTPSRAEAKNYGEFIEWIKSDNINTPYTFLTEAQEYLSEIGFQKCRFVEAGSLLMTCIAGSVNCIGNVAVADRRVAFNQQINAIVPNEDEVLYLYWLMLLSKPAIHRAINMALKGILSKRQLSEMMFPFPPVALQKQFVTFVEQTDKSKYYSSLSSQCYRKVVNTYRQEWIKCQTSNF